MEIWKDIKGFERKYQVSNLGNVKNKRTNRILKGGKDAGGYKIVCLKKDGKSNFKKNHRLVAETFLPNPENKPQINHINGIKTDNRLENLEYCTASENQKHAFRLGLNHINEEHYKKIEQYDLQHNLIRKWDSIKEASETLNLHKSHICECCKGKKKTAYGFIWKYEQKGVH